jgi:hypothetical protein
MRKKTSLARGVAWLIGGAVVGVSGQAAAANCPSGATTVFLSGSSAFLPVVQATAKNLGAAVSLVYQKPGSCEGLQHILGDSGAAATADGDSALSMPTDGTAGVACTLPGTPAAATVDIGISDVYATTCGATFDTSLNAVGSTTMTKDFLGPIQAMTFAVPSNSMANAISAEAAYMVFKFDADMASHTIAPWSTAADIFVRFWDSGTLELIGTAIGLPGGNWANATTTPAPAQQASNSQTMTTKITTAATNGDVNGAIGILGAANIYNVTGIKPLAFQAKGESCGCAGSNGSCGAFYPDSSSSAADKLNVRQGRYAIWGPEHMIVKVDGSGNPVGQNTNTAAVQAVITALTSTMNGPATASSDAGSTLTDATIGTIIDTIATPGANGGVVPWCAMEVQRSAEVGPLSSYQSPAPCVCRYEMATGATVHSHICTACTSDSMCSGALSHCRYGFCEAK